MTFQTGLFDNQRPHGLQERLSANSPFGRNLRLTFGETLEGIHFPRIGGICRMPRLQADQVRLQLGLFMPKPVNLTDHVGSIHGHEPLRRANVAIALRSISRRRCGGGNKNAATRCIPPQQAAILAKRARASARNTSRVLFDLSINDHASVNAKAVVQRMTNTQT